MNGFRININQGRGASITRNERECIWYAQCAYRRDDKGAGLLLSLTKQMEIPPVCFENS